MFDLLRAGKWASKPPPGTACVCKRSVGRPLYIQWAGPQTRRYFQSRFRARRRRWGEDPPRAVRIVEGAAGCAREAGEEAGSSFHYTRCASAWSRSVAWLHPARCHVYTRDTFIFATSRKAGQAWFTPLFTYRLLLYIQLAEGLAHRAIDIRGLQLAARTLVGHTA